MDNNRKFTAIPVYAALVLIPQMLFFWLAPSAAACYIAVYIGLSLITVGVSTTVFFMYLLCGLRRAAGAAAAGLAFEIATGILAVILFSFFPDMRSAIFAYTLLALITFVFMFPLFRSAMNSRTEPPQAITPLARENDPANNGNAKVRLNSTQLRDQCSLSDIKRIQHINENGGVRVAPPPVPPHSRS